MPKLRLTYFNLKARGEPIRLTMAIGGLEFEDERWTFEEFGKYREEKTPYAQLPILTIDDDVTIAQTNGIMRYVGGLCGLYPSANDEAGLLLRARVDDIFGAVDEVANLVAATIRIPEEEKLKVRTKLCQEVLPKKLRLLDARVGSNGCASPYSVSGMGISIADVRLYVLIQQLQSGVIDHIPTSLADKYQNLMRVCTAVKAHPAVQAWERSSPNKPKLKVSYFDSPGNAEPIRLALTCGGIEFEDERLSREEFLKIKADQSIFPYGQMPVLTIDGRVVLAQTEALLRYVGKLTGLYPADPLLAAKVDELIVAARETVAQVLPTFAMKEDEKLAARKELVDKVFPPLLKGFDNRLACLRSPESKFSVGQSLTTADIQIFVLVTMMQSGFLDGIPKTLYQPYENIMRVTNAVNEIEAVKRWYAK